MRLTFRAEHIAIATVAALHTVVYALSSVGGFPLDDSWIHQSYARTLATTGVWGLTPSIPSAASTAPLYTLVLAVGYLLRLPPLAYTHAVGAVALALMGLAAAEVARVMLPAHRRAPLWAGLGVVGTWQMVWAAASGMETALVAALCLTLLWRVAATLNAPPSTVWAAARHGAQLGVLTALALTTRPEAVLAGAVFALATVGALRTRLWWAWTVGGAVAFAVACVPYLALNLLTGDALLPVTSAAKQAQHAPLLALPLPTRVGTLAARWAVGGQVLLLPGVIVTLWGALRAGRTASARLRLVTLLWPLALLLLYALRLPAAYQHGRYVLPGLPFLVLLGVVGTLHALVRFRRPALRVGARAVALAAALTLVVFVYTLGRGAYRTDVGVIHQEMVTAAGWLALNVPADDLLVTHDIGAVGYFAPRPILDVAGLVSPEVIPIIGDADALWALVESLQPAHMMAFPNQIPGQDPTDPRLCLVFVTDGALAAEMDTANMSVYALALGDHPCAAGPLR